MPLILRLTKRSAWPADGSADAREQAVAEFHRRPVDTDGVSVFEVETQAERELVIAAIACGRLKDDRPVDLIAVDRSVVERYGSIAVTLGGSPVGRANLLHRSLDWTVPS